MSAVPVSSALPGVAQVIIVVFKHPLSCFLLSYVIRHLGSAVSKI